MKVKKGGLEENGLEQGIDVHKYRRPTCPCLTYKTGFLLAQSPVNWPITRQMTCAENAWILTNDFARVEV